MKLPFALALPYPPSVNEKPTETWNQGNHAEIRKFKQCVTGACLANRLKPIDADTPVDVVIFRFPASRSQDGDNLEKLLFDSLQQKAFGKPVLLTQDNSTCLLDHHNILCETLGKGAGKKIIVVFFRAGSPRLLCLLGSIGSRTYSDIVKLLVQKGITLYR